MCRWLICLFTLVSLRARAVESSRLTLAPEVQRGDIYNPQGLWPLLGVGMGVMDAGDRVRSGGVPTHLKVLGSYYFDGTPWIADGGLGLHNEFLTQDGPGSSTVQSLYTELAARYQLSDRWQLGAIWNTLVDNPDRYRSNTNSLASFVGVQLLKEFTWSDQYLVRAGGRAMTDVGISGQTINTVMAELQVSFGNTSRPVVESKPVLIQPAPVVVVAPHLARQAMQNYQLEPGPIHFESDSAKLVGTSEPYLRRLAHALASNRQLFEKVEVIGHADQRGTRPYNYRLSEHRARAIANSLVSAGLKKSQVQTIPRGESELLTHSMAPAALARNRRVELQFSGVKNQAALKNIIDSVVR